MNTRKQGGFTILEPVGGLVGGEESDAFDVAVAAVRQANDHDVIVDLTKCRTWNSTGIGQLISLHRELVGRHGRLRVVTANPRLLHALHVLQLDGTLDVCTSLEEALLPGSY